jgi:CheY-like chemotaxis protein
MPSRTSFVVDHQNTVHLSPRGAVGLSAYRPEAISTNAYLAACSVAGADGVLPKPFETAELRAMIEEVFSAERA